MDAEHEQEKLRIRLRYSSMIGFKDHVQSLLLANVDPNDHDEFYRTSLHWAAYNGHTDIVVLLSENGADINATDMDKSTPILLAAKQGHTNVVTYLIRKGANIHAFDEMGTSPLMMASMKGHYSLGVCLIENGADWLAQNKDGENAHSLAMKSANNADNPLLYYINKGVLLQALDEGFVSLSIIKLLLAGPPAVGKTSFKCLLFNWEPPCHHHSTAIADRPVKAVEKVVGYEDKKIWEIVKTKDIMRMLGEDIKAHAFQKEIKPVFQSTNQEPDSSSSPEVKELTDVGASKPLQVEEATRFRDLNDIENNGDYENDSEALVDDEISSLRQPSFIPNAEAQHQNESVIQSEPPSNLAAKLNETIVNEKNEDTSSDDAKLTAVSDDVTVKAPNNDFIVKAPNDESILEISQSILDEMQGEESQKLSESTWVYVLDSGGQPQFADVSRAFVRGNTINVIVHKLTDRLSCKPIFQYSIDGEALTQPKELRMTNLELITTYIHSISAAKLSAVDGRESLPYFMIIGTYEDKMGGFLHPFQQSLRKKNMMLLSALQPFKDQLIFYKDDGEQLIIPVNNMCLENRELLSSRIQTYVTGQKKAVIKEKVPIRWYVLESNIKEEGDKHDHGIVSRAHCEEIGEILKMSKPQVLGAIRFFKSLSVFLYFETKHCSHVVFTNPQYFLNALSSIIRISFVDFPNKLLEEGKILPPDAHRKLRKEGLFTEDLLDVISIKFAPGLFERSDLLHLLIKLCVIARVYQDNITYYFIPAALRPKQLKYKRKREFVETCDPLVLLFPCGVVPQGLFPAAVVAILNRKEAPLFTLACLDAQFPRQLRYAVKLRSENPAGSLLLVDTILWMEVYWTGRYSECSILQSVVTTAIASCAEPLAYHPSALKCHRAILCNTMHRRQKDLSPVHPARVSVGNDNVIIASCTEQCLAPYELTERCLCWMKGLGKEVKEPSSPVGSLLVKYEDVPGVPISINYKSKLLCLLSSIAYKWKILGGALGISHGDLENIRDVNHRNPERLADVIQLWYDRQPSDVTWNTIIIAVGQPPVNEPDIAETIMQKSPL